METEFAIDLGEVRGFKLIFYIIVGSSGNLLSSGRLPFPKKLYEVTEE